MGKERAWYVVHTYSGHEMKVKANLEKRIEATGLEDKIFRILVPTEDKVEVKDGKKQIKKRRIFPGYILVEMIMDENTWYHVRNTPGVTGFVSAGSRPVPLPEDEINSILRSMGEEGEKVQVDFEVGQKVRINDGPFEDFIGEVQNINLEKGKVKVLVSMFGRETPLELDFHQIEAV